MGFCDLCGCHGDYYDRMIELEQTKLKHHSSYTLMFVCNGCFDRLVMYDKGKDVFGSFNFSRQVNEDRYIHIKPVVKTNDGP